MKRRPSQLDLEHRLAYRFAVLSAMSTRSVAEVYRRHGLTIGAWRTLSLIGHYEPTHPGAISQRSSVDPDKITRAVDGLVRKGLVQRRLDAADRRRVVLTLTPRGRKVHDEIDKVRRALERRFVSVLSPQELERFNAALAKLEAHARLLFGARGARSPAGPER